MVVFHTYVNVYQRVSPLDVNFDWTPHWPSSCWIQRAAELFEPTALHHRMVLYTPSRAMPRWPWNDMSQLGSSDEGWAYTGRGFDDRLGRPGHAQKLNSSIVPRHGVWVICAPKKGYSKIRWLETKHDSKSSESSPSVVLGCNASTKWGLCSCAVTLGWIPAGFP